MVKLPFFICCLLCMVLRFVVAILVINVREVGVSHTPVRRCDPCYPLLLSAVLWLFGSLILRFFGSLSVLRVRPCSSTPISFSIVNSQLNVEQAALLVLLPIQPAQRLRLPAGCGWLG